MLKRIIHTLWGTFDQEELSKLLYLAAGAFFLMGTQWSLKLLKDGLVVAELGAAAIPKLKLLAVASCIPLTMGYGYLVSCFRRDTVLYTIIGVLLAFGTLFVYLISQNHLAEGLLLSRATLFSSFYIYGEMLTVLTVTPFWAFVNDIIDPKQAKKGYGLIVFGAQFGGLIFTIYFKYLSAYVKNDAIISLNSMLLLIPLACCIWLVTHKINKKNLEGYKAEKKPVEEKHERYAWLQGFNLLLTSPYVTGIMFITASHEIINAMINYNFLNIMQSSLQSPDAIKLFMYNYGIIVQVIASIFALVGTSYFQNRIGIRTSMILYPSMLVIFMIIIAFGPSLWVTTALMALTKGLHYALNKPVREILYIPTTKEVKYKAKAWIEFFGIRTFKAIG
jgi:AAA family ATP:ADP antiporter